jgi:hypothetical protein
MSHSEIQKLTTPTWNKEQLAQQWRKSIIVLIYKMGDKTDCSNHRRISLSPTTYKILSNNFLSR